MCVLAVIKKITKESESVEVNRHLLATSMKFCVDLDLMQHRRRDMKDTLDLLLLNKNLGPIQLKYLICVIRGEVIQIEQLFDDITENNIDLQLQYGLLIRTLQCTAIFFETVLNMFNNLQKNNH